MQIIPGRLTSNIHPLDNVINKPFKYVIKKKYVKYCHDKQTVDAKVIGNCNQLVSEVWYDPDIIISEMIKKSFLLCGISNSLNGSEHDLFDGFSFNCVQYYYNKN